MEFQERLENLLSTIDKFKDKQDKLMKEQVIQFALRADEELIMLLLSDAEMKKEFFKEIAGVTIFNDKHLVSYLKDKNFLSNSYTQYNNKIGFNIKERLDGEVVLNFPYKDCYLEGGQTKEEDKKNEIFFNEILAKDEITKLLEEKVLTNFEKHTVDGKVAVDGFNRDEHGTIKDNLLIKGNNLLALHSLETEFRGKVKLIYIDPPYNTGNDSFGYNDRFNHSSWLVFMKNRLKIARELLSDDGVMFVQCDDNEAHYAKVVCDEIFGRENFVTNVIWQKKFSPQNDAKWLSDNHDHILIFAKNKEIWRPHLLPRTKEMNARYSNPDNDARGDWTSADISVKTYNASCDYEITTPFGRKVSPPIGYCWRLNKEKYKEYLDDNRIWFGKDGKGVPRIKRFLSEVKDGITSMSIWTHKEVGHNQDAAKEMKEIGFGGMFSTPKPEKLLQRILEISTKPNDIVLDYHSGSGTTLAVAHKMGRQWIGVEQMDYIKNLPEARLIKVIEGEQGGISKAVNWKGGGEFIYTELAEYNQKFITQIKEATTTKKILAIFEEIKTKGFLKYNVALDEIERNKEAFAEMELDEQKQTLDNFLNKNMLYIPISSLHDAKYKISDKDKALNKKFYTKIQGL